MGKLSDLSYNYHKNSAESYIKRKLNFSEDAFKQFKKTYTKELDAFYNAYAEIENGRLDKKRYEDGSDKEIQNWAMGKELQKNSDTRWRDDLFNNLFQPSDKGGYEPNPSTSFMTDNGTLSKNEKDKYLGDLLSKGNELGDIRKNLAIVKFQETTHSTHY